MSCQLGQHFRKCMRLRKRMEDLEVQRRGKRVHTCAFVGLVITRNHGCSRIGITTTKRLGNSVARNRIRRLVREAFRTGYMRLPDGVDVVVIAKKTVCALETKAVFEDLSLLGRKTQQLLETPS